jgi:hypothetical protein
MGERIVQLMISDKHSFCCNLHTEERHFAVGANFLGELSRRHQVPAICFAIRVFATAAINLLALKGTKGGFWPGRRDSNSRPSMGSPAGRKVRPASLEILTAPAERENTLRGHTSICLTQVIYTPPY